VCDLQENTFYALIYLSLNGDTVAIDARPSHAIRPGPRTRAALFVEADALELALRTRAPIFVEEAVIDNAKTFDPVPDKTDTDRLHKWLESLDPDDLGKYKM